MPRALLVDDDEAFRAALAEAVAREGFTTQTAATLEEARAALGAGIPDIVLIDLHLPDGNGMDLLNELGPFPATEVVLITGQASVETAVEALRRGASDYLTKPVDLARVKAVLANATRTRELKQLAAGLPWARRRADGGPQPILGARYEVDQEIGEGSMGRVFRARDPLVGRVVAVKTVKAEYLSDETRTDYFRRFRREAQAAGILSHPGIVSLFDVGDDYLVMEYVEGVTLQHLLRRQRVLDYSTALRVFTPLAEALDYAHRSGVVHRDIKPANIMVQPDGRPKLMDFGVARLDAATASQTEHVFGSPSYMAPEQILGTDVSPRSDLFSFAVVAYEALTGQRPFQGDTVPAIIYRVAHEPAAAPTSLNRALPAACDAVFLKALSKDPSERYPDAIGFMAGLVEAESGSGMPSLSPDPLIQSLVSMLDDPVGQEAATAEVRGPVPPPGSEGEKEAGAGSDTTTLHGAVLPPGTVPRRPHRRWAPWLVVAALAVASAILLRPWRTPAAAPGQDAAAPASLRVETEPRSMPVWIDGREAGRSPLVLPDLAPGTHRIRIAEPGYAPAELTLHLAPGTTAAPLRFVMTPVAVRMAVRSAPADAAVILDGRRIGTTPYDGMVALGAHEVRLEKAGHRSEVRRLDVKAGQPVTLDAPLAVTSAGMRATPPPPAGALASTVRPTPRSEEIVEPDPAVRPPRRTSGPSPEYPAPARREKLAGSVLIEMVVTADGQPRDIHILESAGSVLDEAVIAAAGQWRFEPAWKDGRPVRTRYKYRHTFQPR